MGAEIGYKRGHVDDCHVCRSVWWRNGFRGIIGDGDGVEWRESVEVEMMSEVKVGWIFESFECFAIHVEVRVDYGNDE